MTKFDFSGPELKIERAEHHIHKLEMIFRHYVSENTKRLRPKRQHRLRKQGQVITPAAFPRHTPTVLGDALHNLRAALDHAYCLLVEANQGVINRYTMFPFHRERQSLVGAIGGHKAQGIAPSDPICAAIIDDIQPYDGGQLALYGLHLLDITDKHHLLIPTVAKMRIKHMAVPIGKGGIIFEDVTLISNQAKGGPGFISPGPDGAILEGEPKDTFDICFDEGQPYEGKSILATLIELRDNVVKALIILRETT